MEPTLAVENTPVEVWAALIGAIGVAALAFVVGIMQAAFQIWRDYKTSIKVEAVRLELEKTTRANEAAARVNEERAKAEDERAKVNAEIAKANAEALKEIKETGDKTLKETNHNYQAMQRQSTEDREALAKANAEITKSNKEVADLVKALALSVQSKAQNTSPPERERAEKESHGETVQVENLELSLKKDEKDPTKIVIDELDLSLESKPESEEKE